MKVDAVPLTDFVHGPITAFEGRPFSCERSMADDLERAGLVRIKYGPVRPVIRTRGEGVDAGKAPDDGRGQPSSALPAAPASPPATSESSKRGPRKTRRRGA